MYTKETRGEGGDFHIQKTYSPTHVKRDTYMKTDLHMKKKDLRMRKETYTYVKRNLY